MADIRLRTNEEEKITQEERERIIDIIEGENLEFVEICNFKKDIINKIKELP